MDDVTNGLIAIGLKKELTEREKVIALLNSVTRRDKGGELQRHSRIDAPA